MARHWIERRGTSTANACNGTSSWLQSDTKDYRRLPIFFEYLFKAWEAAVGDLDGPPEEEEECPNPSLPDGQPFVQLAWPIADIVQKLHLQRHRICYPTSLASPRVYLRCVVFSFYSELKP